MRSHALLTAAATALLVAAAPITTIPVAAQETGIGEPTADLLFEVNTPTFVVMAHSANTFEIQSSMLAAVMAEDPAVKAFAEQMLEHHRAAAEAMQRAVEEGGLSMPEEDLTLRHRTMLQALQDGGGATFDAAYVPFQYQVHREAVNLFENYAKRGENAALQAFAAETLPILLEHFAAVRQLPHAPPAATGSTLGGAPIEPYAAE